MKCSERSEQLRILFRALVATACVTTGAVADPQESEQGAADAVPRGASGAVVVSPKASAGAAPAAAAPITVPVLQRDEGAQYPAQALREKVRETVEVVVVVDLDASGAVRKAVVETPAGHGFDEAAIEAAMKLVFAPARRGNTRVAARIKHKYQFVPPQARLVGRVLGQRSDAPVARATVTARAPDGTTRTVSVGADGTYAIDALGAGAQHIEVASPGYATQTLDEELDPGEEASVVFRLEPERRVARAAPAAAGDDIEEVRVRGERPPREITRRTLDQRELSRIPGTNADAFRAIQNLPGVARPPGLAGLLIVRGSAPDSTAVFVEGALIPIIYHFGGLSSVIPTELLEKLDFYPGNFSAQYGRVNGGVIDAALRAPRTDGLHGLAQVDLIDARVLAEGPIGKTGWSFAVAGRRSYVDVWLKPVLQGLGAGVSTAPVYYDYQAMLNRDFGRNTSLKFMFYGSDDRLEILLKSAAGSDPSIGGDLGLHTGFWRAQARLHQRFDEGTELRISGSFGQNVLDFTVGDNVFRLNQAPLTSRIELAQKLAPGVIVNVGTDLLYAAFDVVARLPPPPRPGEPLAGPGLSRPPLERRTSGTFYRPAFYTEFELTPWRGTRIIPGFRVDYSKDVQSWDVAPRLVARQDLTSGFPRTTLKGGVGVFFQPPQPQESDEVFGVPGLRSNKAIHYGFGVEQEITKYVDVSLEGYYKQLDNLVTQRVGNVGRGRAYGLELLLRYKPDARFFGWLAYTLSRSVVRDTPDDPERLAQYDQTHILTVLGSYRLGGGWEIGGRFRLVSGSLTTPSTYGFYDENAGAYLPLQSFPPFSRRLPTFHQLDIRIDKAWQFRGWRLRAYLDVQNVYNQGNFEGISYNYNFTRQTYATGLPILPSLGVRAEF